MDFIAGETLEARLSRVPGGRFPVQEVLQIGVQLCTVLDYLHMRQPPIIFRDLKPANIMVTPGGEIALIDFGIARHFKPGQTKDTVAFGSAGYAAPEQYGKAQTTTQSDIYSLGATLHHLLSGHDPSDNPFLFAPLDLDAPVALEDLILQMVETHPSKRPASMNLIKQDLQRLADDLATGRMRQYPAPGPARPLASNLSHSLLVYQSHKKRINTIAWSPDGTTIASGGEDRTVRIWDSASGRELQGFTKTGRVATLAWSPTGEHLAWVGQGAQVHLWNVPTDDFSQMDLPHGGTFQSLVKSFLALSWSPDGSDRAAGGMGRTVEVWETKTRQHLLTYRGHARFVVDSAIYALAWSPDGQWMASASADATVHVWKTTTCDLRWKHRGEAPGYGGGIAWSPDGQFIASAGAKDAVHIWNATTGAPHLVLNGHTWWVRAVAWSPNGNFVASGSSDRTVRVWDVGAGKEVRVYSDHAGEVRTVVWSPDGTCIASAGDDQTVRIWQVLP